jgi:hypothetical protein
LRRADAVGRLVPIVPDSLDDTPMEERPEEARAQLLAAEAVVVAAAAARRPAAVVPRPTPRPRWTLTDVARQEEYLRQKEEAVAMGAPAPPAPPPPTECWLLGPWDEVELDPTTWAVGTATLCGYTAKEGRLRTGLQAACKADPQRAALGWRPKLWPRPQQGQQGEAGPAGGPAGHLTQLAEAEGRWVQSCLDREAAPPGSRPRLSEAARAAAAAAEAARAAPWLALQGRQALQRPGPEERAERRAQRGQQGAGALEDAAAHQGGGDQGWDDRVDPLALALQPGGGAPAQGDGPEGERERAREEHPSAAWQRLLADKVVTRQHRVTAWRILHGALLVNALRVHVDPRQRAEAGLCSLPACREAAAQLGPQGGQAPGGGARPWETLTHAFMACPAAAPVVDWAWQLWEALTPGKPQPPRCAAVLLLDRGGRWSPPDGAGEAWAALRVTLLGCLWHVRCSREARGWDGGQGGGALASAFRAAAAVVEHLEHAIRRDWDRVKVDVPLLSSDVGSALFSGRKTELSKAAFLGRWGLQGRLCSIRQDGSLRVRLSLDSPVPVPGRVQE